MKSKQEKRRDALMRMERRQAADQAKHEAGLVEHARLETCPEGRVTRGYLAGFSVQHLKESNDRYIDMMRQAVDKRHRDMQHLKAVITDNQGY